MPTQKNISKKIPACIIAEIAKQKLTELQCAVLQLRILALFFAMRSCKYVKVQQQEKRQTKILRLWNLWFFKNGRLVNHHDPSLEFANCINITFELQKRWEKWCSNSFVIRRHHIVPSQGSCRHCSQDPILPRSQQRHPDLRHLAVRPHQTHLLQANQERATGRRLGNGRGHPPHCRQWDRHTLHPLRRGNSNVPW